MHINDIDSERPPLAAPTRYIEFFPAASHEAAVARIRQGINERAGAMALVGEAGIGKTTVLHQLNDQSAGLRTVLLTSLDLSFPVLVERVCTELGIATAGSNSSHHPAALMAHLSETRRAHGNVALLIDDAQHLSPELLAKLLPLANLGLTGKELLQIVLAGDRRLVALLTTVEKRERKARVEFSCALEPFTSAEVGTFIEHRRYGAENKDGLVFSTGAIDCVAARSRGIPDLVEALCRSCLALAKANAAATVTESIAIAAELPSMNREDEAVVEDTVIVNVSAEQLAVLAESEKSSANAHRWHDRFSSVARRVRAWLQHHATGKRASVPSLPRFQNVSRAALLAGPAVVVVGFAWAVDNLSPASPDNDVDAVSELLTSRVNLAALPTPPIGASISGQALERHLAKLASTLERSTADRDMLSAQIAHLMQQNERLESRLDALGATVSLRTGAPAEVAMVMVESRTTRSTSSQPSNHGVPLVHPDDETPMGMPPKIEERTSEPWVELLGVAEEHVAAHRLTTPYGNNALETYRQVLEADPGNQTALSGLATITKRYREWATAARRARKFNRARLYYERALKVSPNDPTLTAEFRKLEHSIAKRSKSTRKNSGKRRLAPVESRIVVKKAAYRKPN